jgi:hypothetical protein
MINSNLEFFVAIAGAKNAISEYALLKQESHIIRKLILGSTELHHIAAVHLKINYYFG